MAGKREREAEQHDELPVMEGQIEIPDFVTAGNPAGTLEVYTPTSANQWRRKLNGAELMGWAKDHMQGVDGDDQLMGLEAWDEIASTQTLDELMANAAETTKGRNLIGVILRCERIRFRPSDKAAGCPVFCLTSIVRTDTGEKETASLGGWWIVGKLTMMHYRATLLAEGSPYLAPEGSPDALEPWDFPFFFRIMEEQTGTGNTRRWLELPMG